MNKSCLHDQKIFILQIWTCIALLSIKKTNMFVYSFLEKNLACAILFDTVRLLFFEVPRLSFFDTPKKQNCCIIAFQLFVIISCSPQSFTNFSDDWWGSHSVLLTFRSFFFDLCDYFIMCVY